MKFTDGEMLVGYRFNANEQDGRKRAIPVRVGAGETCVVEAIACAGPIFYEKLEVMGHAVCRGCWSQSLVGRSDAVSRWAHRHRCLTGNRHDERLRP